MEWFNTTQQIITLLTGLCGFLTAVGGVIAAVKVFFNNQKIKKFNDVLALIKAIADEAMKSAEKTSKLGLDKKEMVIQIVTETCDSQGIDVKPFLPQIVAYIDQSISFVNDMIDANQNK